MAKLWLIFLNFACSWTGAYEAVYTMHHSGLDCLELGKTEKAELLSILTKDVIMNEQVSPLMNALSRTCSSLAKCFEGEAKKIVYPTFRL